MPFFAGRDQVKQQAVRLLCRADGQPDRFLARLGADMTLAVLSRSVSPEKPAVRPALRVTPVTPGAGAESKEAGSALTSPLYVLAYPLYPGNVTGIVAEDDHTGTPGEWQTIFIDNESR